MSLMFHPRDEPQIRLQCCVPCGIWQSTGASIVRRHFLTIIKVSIPNDTPIGDSSTNHSSSDITRGSAASVSDQGVSE